MNIQYIKDNKECLFILTKHGAANLKTFMQGKGTQQATTTILSGNIRGVPSYFVGTCFSGFDEAKDNGYIIAYVHQTETSLENFSDVVARYIMRNADGPISAHVVKPSMS